MSKSATMTPEQADFQAAITAAMAEAVKTAVQSVLPKNVQMMSAEAFAAVDLPRPALPTFQNGMPVDLRGVPEPTLSRTLRQCGEIPSGLYLNGLVRVIRTEPAHNTEGRLDLKYDSSTTEKRMAYAEYKTFPMLLDAIWREAHPTAPAA